MPSKIRRGVLISIAVVGFFFTSVLTSYAETINYIYDELNRLIRVEYGDGSVVEYTYDQAGNRSRVYVGKYTLAVNVVGSGTVTKNPDQTIYSAGTSVTLTAVNRLGTFSAWSGDLTGNTNPTTIVMDGNKSVTATFGTPEGWLQGWTYRKAVTLSRASGAVTNYQMKLLVGESSGAVGYDVHCNGHVLSSFNDLRFTNLNGDVLDYWIESISGTTPNQLATVWIEFDSIGTGATTFYMYYGKADAPAVSNGANTFIVFDDFERGSDGDAIGGSWTVQRGSVKISTDHAYGGTRCMKLLGGATYPIAYISVTAGANISIRFRLWKEDAAQTDIMHGNGSTRAIIRTQTDEQVSIFDGSSYVLTGSSITKDTWQLLELNDWNWTAQTVDVWREGTKIKDNGDISFANSAVTNQVAFNQTVATVGVDSYIDNFLVRNWRATEPAWGSWGAEQAY